MAVSVVDLFCGVGGLTHGFKQENFNVAAGVDIDSSCQYPYEVNNDGAVFHQMDLSNVSAEEINRLFPDGDTKVLVGCAPCQPYSTASHSKRRNDDKWRLVPRFAQLIAEITPTVVSMENVPSLMGFRNGAVIKDFVKVLEDANYHVWHDIVFAPDYGIPQNRKRFVLLASQLGEIELIQGDYTEENYPTVEEAIGSLPPIEAGETHNDDPLHKARSLSNLNMQRMLQSRPGGTWLDWDEDLVAVCHRKESGQSYKSVYARMCADQPSPTITTQAYAFGSGRFGHPEQNRALSLREMAILQSFPADYQFVAPNEKVAFTTVGTLIGNAVPVKLSRAIAQSIERHLESHGVPVRNP